MNHSFSPFNRSCWLQRFWLFFILLITSISLLAQTKVIPLYQGAAPGSEQWNWTEGETSNTPIKFRIAYNVTKPTVTMYKPDSANGAAVLIIPGGGMYVVNIEHEGEMIAKKLVKTGLTVFVLKYRTGRTTSADPWQEMLSNMKDTAVNRQKLEGVRPLFTADAFAAIRHIRNHAADYNLNPKKIGVLGFSGGGGLSLQLCTAADSADRPDFAGLIYTLYRPAVSGPIPSTAPPVFIACANDDELAPPANSTALFTAWLQAKRPAELHIYAKGGHGLRRSKSASDWLVRFEEWLSEMGILK
jgi:acetyl esterase/lipase